MIKKTLYIICSILLLQQICFAQPTLITRDHNKFISINYSGRDTRYKYINDIFPGNSHSFWTSINNTAFKQQAQSVISGIKNCNLDVFCYKVKSSQMLNPICSFKVDSTLLVAFDEELFDNLTNDELIFLFTAKISQHDLSRTNNLKEHLSMLIHAPDDALMSIGLLYLGEYALYQIIKKHSTPFNAIFNNNLQRFAQWSAICIPLLIHCYLRAQFLPEYDEISADTYAAQQTSVTIGISALKKILTLNNPLGFFEKIKKTYRQWTTGFLASNYQKRIKNLESKTQKQIAN